MIKYVFTFPTFLVGATAQPLPIQGESANEGSYCTLSFLNEAAQNKYEDKNKEKEELKEIFHIHTSGRKFRHTFICFPNLLKEILPYAFAHNFFPPTNVSQGQS